MKHKTPRFMYVAVEHRPRLVDVFANTCSHPSCDSPPCPDIASETPLCEVHILDVYKATNHLLVVRNPVQEEYALLPSEQQQVAGPCPACGHCGYLMRTVTDQGPLPQRLLQLRRQHHPVRSGTPQPALHHRLHQGSGLLHQVP